MEIEDLEAQIERLDKRIDTALMTIQSDLKDIKQSINLVNTLAIKMDYQKESIDRAFLKINELEKFQVKSEALFNKFDGLKVFAIVLWAVMGSSVAAALFKLFVN